MFHFAQASLLFSCEDYTLRRVINLKAHSGESWPPMRDDFPEEVKRVLAGRVASVCSNVDCRVVTSGPQVDPMKALNVGVAAHITSAAEGGPRYNSLLTSEQRRHADNGIWLCQTCAKLIDNDELRYPESVVRAWKVIAEHRALNSIGKRDVVAVVETEAQRKFRAIRPWVGKIVKLSQMSTGNAVHMLGPVRGSSYTEILDCTEFSVVIGKSGTEGYSRPIAMANIEVCFDAAQKLELQERYV
jgi:hypothetical protein